MDNSFKLLEFISKTICNWKLLFLFMIIGAGAGDLAHYSFPPLYESTSSLTISIDYSRTGLLTDVEEDQVMGMVGDLITSSEVITGLMDKIVVEGIEIDEVELHDASSLERNHEKWVLRIQHTDPSISAFIANTWIDLANEMLIDAHSHAVNAANYQKYLDSIESCLGNSVVTEPASAFCTVREFSRLQNEMDTVGKALLEEKLLSRGISPVIGFQISSYAVPAIRPTRYARGALILAGSTVGFCVFLLFIKFMPWKKCRDQEPSE